MNIHKINNENKNWKLFLFVDYMIETPRYHNKITQIIKYFSKLEEFKINMKINSLHKTNDNYLNGPH